jgi:hypothetical protein
LFALSITMQTGDVLENAGHSSGASIAYAIQSKRIWGAYRPDIFCYSFAILNGIFHQQLI